MWAVIFDSDKGSGETVIPNNIYITAGTDIDWNTLIYNLDEDE